MNEGQSDEVETRQERRQKRLEKKKEKMPQHGRALGHLYRDATLKRADHLPTDADDEKRKGMGQKRSQ